MAGTVSPLDWILELFRSPDARAAFQADPEGYAGGRGFDNLSSAHVSEALMLIADGQSTGHEHRLGCNAVHYPPPAPTHAHGADGAHYLDSYLANSYTVIEEDEILDTDSSDFDQVSGNVPVVARGNGAVAASGHHRWHRHRRRPGPGCRRLPAETGTPRRGAAVSCQAAGRRPFMVRAESPSAGNGSVAEPHERDLQQDQGQDRHRGPAGPG